nr:hypothetical protein [Tanacetum cinerariifolium]
LLGKKINKDVLNTALRLAISMKSYNLYMIKQFCGGLDVLEPLAFQQAETQRLAKESAEEVQCACAFESSKDVLDNDIVVDEFDIIHTLTEINDSEVLQQIFLEYPFHKYINSSYAWGVKRSRVLTMLATLGEDTIKDDKRKLSMYRSGFLLFLKL